MIMKVKTTGRTWVVPSTPTRKHWISLSNLDRVVNPTFVSVIFFYEGILHSTPYSEVVSKLKESLRDVLVQFYPLAGRLTLREDGLVDLLCNDAGAMFLEATVEQELGEAGAGGYGQPFPALSGIDAARLGPGPIYLPDQIRPLPVLIIQLTRFTCKSISLAVNWHHTVADGYSGCHFVKSWSEVARREPILIMPVHDRHLLKPRESLDPSLVQQYSNKTLKMEDLNSVSHLRKEPALSKIFHIGKEKVQKLRNMEHETQSTDDVKLSTVEVVSAFLWKVMVSARPSSAVDSHEDADDDQNSHTANLDVDISSPKRTRFFMFVDGRKRLNLPPGYFGNVVCSACAVSDEEEIRSESLSHIGKLIRKATRSVSEEYFRSLIDWVEVKGLTSSRSEHVNSVGQDVAGTFWIHFPLYEIDFGFGRPTFATRNAPPRPFIDGIGMMPSPQGPGDMAAVLNLHSDRMRNLEADPIFKSMFSHPPPACPIRANAKQHLSSRRSSTSMITDEISREESMRTRSPASQALAKWCLVRS